MQPFTIHRGLVAVMDRVNVDTDQIIPKQFLKRIERTGFGKFLFYDWRFLDHGEPDPAFELNLPGNQGASILVAGRNFGCGSSREHAVWALADYGFRCVIASSYSDIFYNNCFKNGVLPIVVDEQLVRQLMDARAAQPDYHLEINLEQQTIRDDGQIHETFEIDPVRKYPLLRGLDDIALTLEHEDRISAYEQANDMPPVSPPVKS